MLNLLNNTLILIGSIFILIAAIGLLRLPNIYLKMHAAAKSATLGAGLVLFGVGMQVKEVSGVTEIFLLIMFIALTNPISSHLIAKTYYMINKNR